MPRIHSTKTTTLYLPPANPKVDREPVTLEVLIMAQKIARDRGNVFDIEAFMPENLREQWEAMKRGEEWPKREKVGGEGSGTKDGNEAGAAMSNGNEGGIDGQTGVDNGNGNADGPSDVLANDTATITNTGEAGDSGASAQVTDPNASSTSTDVKPTTEPPVPTKQPFKLTPSHPALLNMHWKQRQKRLAQLAARDAAIEKGLVPEYFPELEALIRLEEEKEREKEREAEAGQKRKRGMTATDIEGIRHSASHWNHLLVEARRMRGPQWDYNTQQFLVDRSSEDYYTHMKPPRSDTSIKQDPQLMNGNTHAAPSSSQSANRSLPTRQSSSPVKPPMGMMQPPPGPGSHDQRRMSMTGNQQTPQSGQIPGPGYHPSPHQQQQHQQMYPTPPNQYQQQHQQQQQQQFNPAQYLAMQQQQQQQQQSSPNQHPNQTPNQSPGMMNPALLMQAQQRLQAQAIGGQGQGQGQGVNMASLMAGHGHGQNPQQGQAQAPAWNPNMGLSPAMMQSMGVGMGGGGSTAGGPMLGGSGWTGGQ